MRRALEVRCTRGWNPMRCCFVRIAARRQIRLPEHMRPLETVSAAATSGMLPPPDPRAIDWPVALRSAGIVALVGAVLKVIALLAPAVLFLATPWGCGLLDCGGWAVYAAEAAGVDGCADRDADRCGVGRVDDRGTGCGACDCGPGDALWAAPDGWFRRGTRAAARRDVGAGCGRAGAAESACWIFRSR